MHHASRDVNSEPKSKANDEMRIRPQVRVISLGGTIAMTKDSGGKMSPGLSAKDLGSMLNLPDDFDVELSFETFESVPSAHLSISNVIDLALELKSSSSEVGVVVSQGTDTLEEVAFLVDVLYPLDAPVVFTGAMKPPSASSTDFADNLLGAIRLASTDAARGCGVLVAMNAEIHSAQHIRKTHSSSLAAFHSPNLGPIGFFAEGSPRILARPRRRTAIDLTLPVPTAMPLVPIYRVSLGDDGTALQALVEGGAAGLVIEAFGAGHVSRGVRRTLARLSDNIPTVLTTRTGGGQVFRETYGFEGSETDLLDLGILWGGLLDGPRARILLLLGLLNGAENYRDFDQLIGGWA